MSLFLKRDAEFSMCHFLILYHKITVRQCLKVDVSSQKCESWQRCNTDGNAAVWMLGGQAELMWAAAQFNTCLH